MSTGCFQVMLGEPWTVDWVCGIFALASLEAERLSRMSGSEAASRRRGFLGQGRSLSSA